MRSARDLGIVQLQFTEVHIYAVPGSLYTLEKKLTPSDCYCIIQTLVRVGMGGIKVNTRLTQGNMAFAHCIVLACLYSTCFW